MRTLILTPDIEDLVAAEIKTALLNIIPMAALKEMAVPKKGELRLSDRPADFHRPFKPEPVSIPDGYEACYSIEEQPIGLCGHLSVSVDVLHLCPSETAMVEIAKLYGLPRDRWVSAWVEEFAPDRWAVNVLCPLA